MKERFWFYVLTVAMALLVLAPVGTAARPHTATSVSVMPALYKNCTSLNKKYPHGVGRRGAVDDTSGDDPVTNFKRSTALYNLAMRHNKRLDRDKDGVACEKA